MDAAGRREMLLGLWRRTGPDPTHTRSDEGRAETRSFCHERTLGKVEMSRGVITTSRAWLRFVSAQLDGVFPSQ